MTSGHELGWVATALLVLASGCPNAEPAGPVHGSARGQVRTDVVVRGDLQTRVLITGEIRAVHSDELVVPRTRAWNLSVRWMAEDGSTVREGDKVLEFDNSAFTGDLDQKQLLREQAKLDLSTQAALSATSRADKALERRRQQLLQQAAELRASIPAHILSARDHQVRTLEVERARVARRNAEQALRAHDRTAALDLEVRQIELDKAKRDILATERIIAALTLSAPRDGILIVGEHPWEGRKFQVGDVVMPGFTMMELPDLTQMRVAARLSDVDDGSIAIGMRADCVLDAYPARTVAGKVIEISPVAREAGQRSLRREFDVVIELDETDQQRMRPGMSVKVEIVASEVSDALLVPRAAVDFSVAPPTARRADGTDAPLELGPCSAQQCVVTDGLRAGDRLRARGGGV